MEVRIRFRLTPAGGAEIRDGLGNDIYKGKGRVLSLFRTKRLYDMNGQKLFTIRNKFFHVPLTRSALIKNSEGRFARIKWSAHNLKYIVKDCPYEIVIQGKLLDPNFVIFKNGVLAANARSEISLNGLVYLNIVDPADADFLVALIIALNNINKNN